MSKMSGKNESTDNQPPKMAAEVIILNKPFLGGWLNEGHIAHEIIDFLLDDNGNHYIYGLHSGTCPENIWVGNPTDECIPNRGAPIVRGKTEPLKRIKKEKYAAKYLVLTSNAKRKGGKDRFDILYVIELAEKLHRLKSHKHSEALKTNRAKTMELVRALDIKYNGKPLDECFKNDWGLAVTYRARKIYEADGRIAVSLSYKWRNKGYIWSDDKQFKTLKKKIEDAIKNKQLKEFVPSKVGESGAIIPDASRIIDPTFLKVLDLQDYEQAYTNMLYAILRIDNGNLLKMFCSFLQERNRLPKGVGDVSQWKVVKVDKEKSSKEPDKSKEERPDDETKGRMDVCAEIFAKNGQSLIQRVVIENKIDSGLNGLDKGNKISQLNTYYKWGAGEKLPVEKKPKRSKPICIVVAPTYRINDLRWEIKEIDKNKSQKDKMLNPFHPKYHLVTYGDVADFIDEHKAQIANELPSTYVDQFSQSFREHSLEKKEDYAWRFFRETENAK